MSDLISRQAAIEDVKSWVAVDGREKHLQKDVIEWLKEFPSAQPEIVLELLKTQPTIEPQKGKWKEHKDYPGLAYLCSECGYFTTMRTNFCPNCGADMREGGEDA